MKKNQRKENELHGIKEDLHARLGKWESVTVTSRT